MSVGMQAPSGGVNVWLRGGWSSATLRWGCPVLPMLGANKLQDWLPVQLLMLLLAYVRSQTDQFSSAISDYFLISSSNDEHTLGSASSQDCF